MANVDAFNEGFDAGSGRKSKTKTAQRVKQLATSAGQRRFPGAPLPQYKKGGKVRKTGIAKVHKGEIVLTAAQAKSYGKGGKKRASRKRAARKA